MTRRLSAAGQLLGPFAVNLLAATTGGDGMAGMDHGEGMDHGSGH
mgnify:CR=1 FL=1